MQSPLHNNRSIIKINDSTMVIYKVQLGSDKKCRHDQNPKHLMTEGGLYWNDGSLDCRFR